MPPWATLSAPHLTPVPPRGRLSEAALAQPAVPWNVLGVQHDNCFCSKIQAHPLKIQNQKRLRLAIPTMHLHLFHLILPYQLQFVFDEEIPVVPHKAVAEVSKIESLQERLVVVNHGWQSESTDGPKGGWSCVFWSGCNGCSGHLTTTVGCSVV